MTIQPTRSNRAIVTIQKGEVRMRTHDLTSGLEAARSRPRPA